MRSTAAAWAKSLGACNSPTAGAGWATAGRPERQRATYHKRHGTRYVFGAYDLHEGWVSSARTLVLAERGTTKPGVPWRASMSDPAHALTVSNQELATVREAMRELHRCSTSSTPASSTRSS
jgi:hypothetical protein